jgi:hypothetical protein
MKYIHSIKRFNSTYYLEKAKRNKRFFETELEAKAQAKLLREERLKEIKEEKEEEKEYRRERLQSELEELKEEAKKLKIDLNF